MYVSAEIYERRRLLSALETIQLLLSFGMFTIALIKLIVDLLKNDKKITANFSRRIKGFFLMNLISLNRIGRLVNRGKKYE